MQLAADSVTAPIDLHPLSRNKISAIRTASIFTTHVIGAVFIHPKPLLPICFTCEQ
jgi:hypothetical protein